MIKTKSKNVFTGRLTAKAVREMQWSRSIKYKYFENSFTQISFCLIFVCNIKSSVGEYDQLLTLSVNIRTSRAGGGCGLKDDRLWMWSLFGSFQWPTPRLTHCSTLVSWFHCRPSSSRFLLLLLLPCSFPSFFSTLMLHCVFLLLNEVIIKNKKLCAFPSSSAILCCFSAAGCF